MLSKRTGEICSQYSGSWNTQHGRGGEGEDGDAACYDRVLSAPAAGPVTIHLRKKQCSYTGGSSRRPIARGLSLRFLFLLQEKVAPKGFCLYRTYRTPSS